MKYCGASPVLIGVCPPRQGGLLRSAVWTQAEIPSQPDDDGDTSASPSGGAYNIILRASCLCQHAGDDRAYIMFKQLQYTYAMSWKQYTRASELEVTNYEKKETLFVECIPWPRQSKRSQGGLYDSGQRFQALCSQVTVCHSRDRPNHGQSR